MKGLDIIIMICILRVLLAIAVFRLMIIIIRLFDLVRFWSDFTVILRAQKLVSEPRINERPRI